MKEYHYKITRISEEEQWIFISSDDKWDREEPDSFICLLQRIKQAMNSEIIALGDTRYKFTNDSLNLIFQWDSLFGITVEYRNKVKTIQFLSDFL